MVRAKKIGIDKFEQGICAVYGGIIKINFSCWFVSTKDELDEKIKIVRKLYGDNNNIKCRIFPSSDPEEHFNDFIKTKNVIKHGDLIEGAITMLTTTLKKITGTCVIPWSDTPKDDTSDDEEVPKKKSTKKKSKDDEDDDEKSTAL